MTVTLYHAEGACSEVTLVALRRTGIAHTVATIDFACAEQKGAAFRAVNAMSKVPALLIGATVLTENVAILQYLDGENLEAQLLPHPVDRVARAAVVSDLVWCGATLHPLARAIYDPSRLTDGDGDGVRAKALAQMTPIADRSEARLAQQAYWFGPTWSIVDTYLGMGLRTGGAWRAFACRTPCVNRADCP